VQNYKKYLAVQEFSPIFFRIIENSIRLLLPMQAPSFTQSAPQTLETIERLSVEPIQQKRGASEHPSVWIKKSVSIRK